MMKIKIAFFYVGFLAFVCIQVESTSTQTKLPQETSCGEVQLVKNAIPSIQSGFVGDEVNYTCIDRLLQIGVGNGRRICNATGAWQRVAHDADPVCEVSPCSQPPVVANAKSTVFRISVDLLSASYACKARFVLADGGQGNRLCNENVSSNETRNATWELTAGDVDPICVKPGSDCDEPPPVANAHRTLTDNEVTYTCYAGYNVTSGHLHRVCMMNGSFCGSSPVCTFHCGEPQDLVDQNINITSYRGGSVATVTCKSAAVANISGTITCNVTSRSWDKSGIECTERLTPGWTKLNGLMKLDAAAAIDSSRSTCTSTGISKINNWTAILSGVWTLCDISRVYVVVTQEIAAMMPELTVQLVGGEHSFCGLLLSFSATGEASLTCQKLKGSYPWGRILNIIANFSKTTNGTGSLGLCEVTFYGNQHSSSCPSPPYFEGLRVPYLQGCQDSRYCLYTCDYGLYAVTGRHHISCDTFGIWSKPTLVCTDRENLALTVPAVSNTGLTTMVLTDDKIFIDAPANDNITSWTLDIGYDVVVEAVSVDVSHRISPTEILIVVHVTDEQGMAQVCAEKKFVMSSDVDLSKTNLSEISTVGVECTQPRLASGVNVKFSGTMSPPEWRLREIRVFGRKGATECVESLAPESYLGRINFTRKGYSCQRWDQQNPHSHSYNNSHYFPDMSLADSGNFCRNPNRSRSSIWCYVDTVNMEWDYCPTIVCDEHCLFDFDGRHYYGQESVTASGHQCLPWDAEGLPFSRDLDFPYGKGPSCRNPCASQTVPWCYTSVEPLMYEHCRIPNCPNVLNVAEDKPSVWVTVLLCVSHEGQWLNRSVSILYREELCGLSDAGPLTSLFCRLDQHFVLIILNCSEAAAAPTPQDTTSTGASTAHDTVSKSPPAPQTHNFCACACNRLWPRLMLADPTLIYREVQAIRGVLKVEKMALSANIRKKTSVTDERVSVAATGCLFIAAFLIVFTFFLASDVVSVFTFLLTFLAPKQAPVAV